MSTAQKIHPWSEDFDNSFDKFLSSGKSEDLIYSIVDFHCYGHEYCMACPLASHNNNIGRDTSARPKSYLWALRGWCSLMLCANEALLEDSLEFEFGIRGGMDGQSQRSLFLRRLQKGVGEGTLHGWLQLIGMHHKKPFYQPSAETRIIFGYVNPSVFLFKFLPIWLNAKE